MCYHDIQVYDTIININKLLLYLLIIYDTTNMHWHHKWHDNPFVSQNSSSEKGKTKILLTQKYQISLRNRIGHPLLVHKGNV